MLPRGFKYTGGRALLGAICTLHAHGSLVGVPEPECLSGRLTVESRYSAGLDCDGTYTGLLEVEAKYSGALVLC